ncbi:DUF3347 domain-containing protein [Antarcticibacterium flavum]|uniref:DUF3347 domain-containing protein n=1 Tax=Antarcticibacterium flavum TaxID=2058175 RepID=A0A5B7X149_9FLAO|nr:MULTISPECIES: DUF3347 domain-containing protein [Antarcticibacterium]MCM4161023.1 hypothetical protein [Antarcticibacterium sp. W02-3]QCY69256.1 DUF3347 domain-containing protein [Antarcticibacterium flavum]
MKKTLRNLMMLSLVAGTLSMTSCRETKEDEAAEPMQHEMREGEDMEHDMDHTTGDDVVLNDEITAEFQDEEIASVYQHYIDIKQALVQTDAEMAQDRAKGMIADLETEEGFEDLAASARRISTSTNVNEQREAFSDLTKAMETKLEGALASGEIYKQYCPMAFEGKGDAWFSNVKEIRNPYYGDKMLKCGRVEATIQ